MERRAAVIDLGSNSFRLVVFTWTGDWWKRTDEIYEPVRIGEGLSEGGVLRPEPMERAARTLELFDHFTRATGIEDVRPVATSAIREAGNQAEFLAMAKKRTGLDIRVLSQEEEARYGYLAAVNSTTLSDGVALDIGGGSMQLTRVADRLPTEMRSWRLGAVRMTERFLPGKRQTRKDVKALRTHVQKKMATAPWMRAGGRLVGVGGTVRNLATGVQHLAGQPAFGVQGVEITREALEELIDRLLELPAHDRSKVPGIKPGRADIILAGAVVIDAVMEAGGFDSLEATQAGLREGVFFETLMEGTDPPLIADVRRSAVLNLSAQYHPEHQHTQHVADLSLEMWDALAKAGRFDPAPGERDLIWAAAMLHDVGTAVDYDDHHKHSRYLILNAGLPGHSARETALIAQMARYHRKGSPSMGELAPHGRPGDEDVLNRGSAVLRIAEQLERARDQVVEAADLRLHDGTADLVLKASDDVTLARRSAEREAEIFERAFGVTLSVR
jgi:exopolyphosphatase/guanosine-5'-triphosphate,3'-diphosphate pyrophosphatase